MDLYIRQLPLGTMKNFVYLVGPKDGTEVAVIDPAWDVPAIERAAAEDRKTIVAAIASHCHHDHINGLPELLSRVDVPVYAQRAEIDFSPELRRYKDSLKPVGASDTVTVGALELTLLHTPGHTPGSQCVWAGDSLVSGDTVFVNGCGRCDFNGGSPEAMYDTIHNVLLKLPHETRLFPGHDYGDAPVSSLAREQKLNPYFQLPTVTDFVRYRMRPR